MKIVCDSCGTKYSISDDKVRGKVFKIRCKKCSHIIVVRGTSDAASAAPAAVEGGWHLVVDGEQVGPLPETEIRGKLERGEVNGDTYVWKEGFADWLKLSGVPDFADLVSAAPAAGFGDAAVPGAVNGDGGSGRQPAARGGGLFGGVAAAAGGEDSDVFAAPAPAAARGGGGDLFAAPAAHAGSDEPRWPAQGAASASHDGGRIESLTGQRHENSVLFSLSNLQSLAMPSAASKPLSNSAPTSEGSGLIDIRAMAATTLGAPSDSRFGGSSDELPSFGAFSSAAPVLLPLQSSGPPKWVYPIIGGMVVLVAVIGFMAYKIINTKPPAAVSEAAPAAPPPAASEAAKPSAPVAAAAPTAAGKPSTIPDEKLPPREGGKVEGKAEGKSEKPEHHRGKGGKDREKKSASAEEKKTAAATAVASGAPEPMEKKPAKGSLDDLLEGALNGRKGGAAKPRPADEDAATRRAEPASAGPLSKGAVVSGMNAVKPKIGECYAQYKVPGMAMVNVVIGKSGKVSSATVTGKFASTPTGTCVEKAVKSASFPPSDGLSTPYPFQLR